VRVCLCLWLYARLRVSTRRVKSDALFSYQPPFNLLAFLLLWPSSWFLSPRALHSVNVLLIRITARPPCACAASYSFQFAQSFPTLVAIALYERHIKPGGRLRLSDRSANALFYGSLPRHAKAGRFVDALMGAGTADVYDALFDVDAADADADESADELFPDTPGGERTALRSLASAERLRPPRQASPSPSPARTPAPAASPSAALAPAPAARILAHRPSRSTGASPVRRRAASLLPPHIDTSGAGEVPSRGAASPLARLFGSALDARAPDVVPPSPLAPAPAPRREEEREAGYARQLREEMKELQVGGSRVPGGGSMLTKNAGAPGADRELVAHAHARDAQRGWTHAPRYCVVTNAYRRVQHARCEYS
jgi:hypothetical protein